MSYWAYGAIKQFERQRKERVERRESIKGEHKKKSAVGGQELCRIKLSAEEKQKLQAKILELQREQFEKGTSKKIRRAFSKAQRQSNPAKRA